MVAQGALRQRVVLLRQQPRRAGQLEQLGEQLLGVARGGRAQVRLDQPRRADVEAALDAGQAVVVAVAEDRRARAQLRLDRRDRGEEPRVVDGEQAGQADLQHRRVQLVVAVGDGVGAAAPRPSPCRGRARRWCPAAPAHASGTARPARSDERTPGRRSSSTSPSSTRCAAGRRRASQMPWSGSCQRRSTARPSLHQQRESPRRRRAARLGQGGHQVGHRAEHVELHLAVGGVADPHRAGAGVAGQRLDDRLRAERCRRRVYSG